MAHGSFNFNPDLQDGINFQVNHKDKKINLNSEYIKETIDIAKKLDNLLESFLEKKGEKVSQEFKKAMELINYLSKTK